MSNAKDAPPPDYKEGQDAEVAVWPPAIKDAKPAILRQSARSHTLTGHKFGDILLGSLLPIALFVLGYQLLPGPFRLPLHYLAVEIIFVMITWPPVLLAFGPCTFLAFRQRYSRPALSSGYIAGMMSLAMWLAWSIAIYLHSYPLPTGPINLRQAISYDG